jgi:hypothetical protein
MLLRLTVAVSAAPGESEVESRLAAPRGDAAVGEGGMGVVEMAEGGGEVPSKDDRPRPGEEARMVWVVGTLGERVDGVEGDVEDGADCCDAEPSNEFWVTTPGRPELLDEKLLTDPRRSVEPVLVARRAVTRAGVEKELVSGFGDAEDDDPPDMVCAAMLSASSLADSSLDRVRPIFLEGVWPMARDYG